MFAEFVSAQLGRSLQLPIPRPMLVRVDPAHLPVEPAETQDPKITTPTWMFGSQALGYPNLHQETRIDKVEDRLRKWRHALAAGCFDELIANADRHRGNILWCGGDSFSLIDHSHAFPRDHNVSDPIRRNTFLTLVAPNITDEVGKARILRKSRHQILPEYLKVAQQDWLEITRSTEYCSDDEVRDIVGFLNERLGVISQLVGNQLGERQGDLYAVKL